MNFKKHQREIFTLYCALADLDGGVSGIRTP